MGIMSETTEAPTWRTALLAAIDKAGGKTALMRQLNESSDWQIASHNVISQWVENGVPAKYCPDIERLTGASCESLCPSVNWAVLRASPEPTKAGA